MSLENLISTVQRYFELKELDCGEFSAVKAGPMKFKIRHWSSPLLGNVSLMSGSAMFGLMKMDTLIITPRNMDLPLLSMDTILVSSKFTAIAEIYNTCIKDFDQSSFIEAASKLSSLKDREVKSQWYDSIRLGCSVQKIGTKKDIPLVDEALEAYLKAYLTEGKKLKEIVDKEEKEEKNSRVDSYVDGLLEHGGPSTDVFVKKFGKEKTAELYHKILF